MFRPEDSEDIEVVVPEIDVRYQISRAMTGVSRLEVDPMCGFNFFHDNDYMGWLDVKELTSFNSWYEHQMQLNDIN